MTVSKILKKNKNIVHYFFGMRGGVSSGQYRSLNCGIGSLDSKKNILKNINIAKKKIGCKKENLVLLNQVHSNKIFKVKKKDFSINSKSIKLIGRVSHKACLSIMKKSSALLFLSSYESLGLPLIEASINKKSVIVPDLNYSRELIGNTAYFLEYPLNVKTDMRHYI